MSLNFYSMKFNWENFQFYIYDSTPQFWTIHNQLHETIHSTLTQLLTLYFPKESLASNKMWLFNGIRCYVCESHMDLLKALRAELTSTATYSWLKILKGTHFVCIYSAYTELLQPLLIGKSPEKNYNTHNHWAATVWLNCGIPLGCVIQFAINNTD